MINKELLTTYGLAFLVAIFGFWIAYQFVQPAPPNRIVMSTGRKDGAYYLFAQEYQEVLARSGITLEIRTSAGSLENVERLDKGEVDIAFVQGGTYPSKYRQHLVSLGSMYYEPLWVFYRSPAQVSQIIGLKGKRIAVGEEGSGTRAVGELLLKENGIRRSPTVLSSLGGRDASNALLKRDVDAAFFIASPRSPTVQGLLTESPIKLMDFRRAEAYTRRHRHLFSLTFPQAVIDLQRNIPPHDTTLIATTANLLVGMDFHPALVDLVLTAAKEIHGAPGLFEEQDEFPSPRYSEFPLSEEAERYYRRGPSFLRRVLPFWAATFVDRMIVLLIPLVALLYPLFKVVPPTYRWRMRAKIYRWYKLVKAVDLELQDEQSAERLRSLMAELDRIEGEVKKITTPLPYASQLYDLRLHIELLRERFEKATKERETEIGLQEEAQ
ncbi:MAG: TAXI family TRAP transporter solute-binding subunit [Candidatus Methylomirabilales bacterium]